ncbi:MAG: PEGA domain-containing protein [Planctomycetota bacterium]
MRLISFIFCLSSFIFLAEGCAEHRILITSEPAGAKVTLDGQDKGITPLSVPFTFYGKREVLLEKDGYQTYKSIIPVNPPILQVFPIDIMMFLIPYPFVDNHSFYFILEKQGKTDIKKSLERMERLKDHLEEKLKEDGVKPDKK